MRAGAPDREHRSIPLELNIHDDYKPINFGAFATGKFGVTET
jgi:hypothetical protein